MSLRTASDLNLVPTQADDASSEEVIRLDGVSVRYRVPHERYATLKEHAIRTLQRRIQYDDFWALCDVNLQIRRGEVVGIIGRNGAGKSTLLKVISRVLRPTAGQVQLRGRIAPLLEFGAGFHPELTGRENVFLNGAILGFSRAQMEAKFQDVVDFSELGDFIDAPLRTYSSGMVARLGFAVATDVNPDVLILDEVLSVGDVAFQKKSAERIQAFRAAGATILVVSHSPDAVKTMCTRAIWLEHGKLVADGTAESVVHQYLERDQIAEEERLLAQVHSEPLHRWGTRRIEIVRVRLTDAAGKDQTIFQTGDTFLLHLDYMAHEPILSPIFGMAIHRHDGVHITGPNTAFAGLKLPQLQGSGTVVYKIPTLLLLDGLYHISVAVVSQSDDETMDYHDRMYPFRVDNQNNLLCERYGVLTFQGEWTHRS